MPAATPPCPHQTPLSPPKTPCLQCAQLVEHEVEGRGVVTCDPIMAAIGVYYRMSDAERKAEFGPDL